MVQNEAMIQIKNEAMTDIEQAQDEKKRYKMLRSNIQVKGQVTGLMKQMKDLPKEDRPAYGQRVNEVRQAIEGAVAERQTLLAEAQLNQQLAEESIDVTLPGRTVATGAQHPLTRTVEEIEDLFQVQVMKL